MTVMILRLFNAKTHYYYFRFPARVMAFHPFLLMLVVAASFPHLIFLLSSILEGIMPFFVLVLLLYVYITW